ncbi:MAG: terminase [Sphingobacteriaceae bacterium]|jgi:hypothetical protein|nr:terminase [Sphingobacteriaceae bacterium]
MPTIEIEIDESVYLPCYRHLLGDSNIDIEFLYGGRDSGKSRHTAQQLVETCLSSDYFQCLIIRKVLNTVRDSQYSLIKSVIEAWGLTELFSFNETRMEIRCKANGNAFYGRGLDDVGRIKSFNNPSHCWIEEGNQIDNEDFTIVLTSLRYNEGNVKTYFTFNPECEGNYTDFWLWQEYFQHTEELSWTWCKTIEIPDDEPAKFNIRATHTTYRNNPYCSSQRKAIYEGYKKSKNNAYWYQTYTLGLWGYRRTGGSFWKCFDETIHVKDLKPAETAYHVVLDNNVNPYISVQVWQVLLNEKKLRQIKDIPCTSPNNTASKSAKLTAKWLSDMFYADTLHIYGDPSANAKSTVDDDGRSFFDKYIAQITSEGFRISNKVQKSAPGVSISGDFINEIYENGYDGWTIEIDTDCRKSIEDYSMAKEASDGTILKKRVTDKETGASYEKYGHFSDCKRYFITTVLKDEFNKYSSRYTLKRPKTIF